MTPMTQSLEDYLEMVSFLSDEGEVRVTDIAARLGFSKPSVLSALKTLEDQGLLEHERYSTVSLTKKGKNRAAAIRERHSFLTLFLRDIIGVGAETAEKDACKIEHILSDETLQKLKTFSQRETGHLTGDLTGDLTGVRYQQDDLTGDYLTGDHLTGARHLPVPAARK